MTNHFAVGIDLGTSTSEICIFEDGQVLNIPDPSTKTPIVPSIVAITRQGQLLVGSSAKSRVDLLGAGVREVKRKMGSSEKVELLGKDYRPEEISAQILLKLKKNAEERLGKSIQEVVLSVPANFDNAARQATLDAASLAGLKIIRLINEPTAAALAFGIKNTEAKGQLVVFDFGGGTLDITVLEMIPPGFLDVKCSFGDRYLGGKDFDEALIKLILKKFQTEHSEIQVSEASQKALKSTAEETKKALSENLSHTVYVSNFGIKDREVIDLEVEISRKEFEQEIQPLLQRAHDCLQQALNAKQIDSSSIDQILLVGGTTYIPAVRQLVVDFFGKEPKTGDISPDLAVSNGAAIAAAVHHSLIEQEEGIMMTDVSPFGLGIQVLAEKADKHGNRPLEYFPLIQPNTRVPFKTEKQLSLVDTKQKALEIHIYQDHTGKAKLPQEAIDTGIVGWIRDIPESTNGTPLGVTVEFSYDKNGLAKLKATIPEISRDIEINYDRPAIFSANTMTSDEIAEAEEDIAGMTGDDGTMNQFLRAKKNAQKLIQELPSTQTAQLTQALQALDEASKAGNAKAEEKTGVQLTRLVFKLNKSKSKV